MSESTEPRAPSCGTILDQRFRLEQSIGGGGMGAVYQAFDLLQQQKVALKLVMTAKEALTPILQQRMLREIKVLMLAEDPRVITLLDWGRDPQHGLYYTMEWLDDAISLKDHLARQLPAFWECLRLLREILCGLVALHEIKAIHRDIKPANILCVGEPTCPGIKLIDPGIAKWFPDDLRSQVTVETSPQGFVGTPPYMAPEMWQGHEPDARTDIYQCGILGYELLTGELPFQGALYQVMFNHIQTPLPSLVPKARTRWPALSENLLQATHDCIQMATAKEPGHRYASARDYIKALDALEPYRTVGPKVPIQQHSSLAFEETLGYQLPSLDLPTAETLAGAQSHRPSQTPQPAPHILAPTLPPRRSRAIGLVAGLLFVFCCLGLGLWMTYRPHNSGKTTRQLTPAKLPARSILRPTPARRSLPPSPPSTNKSVLTRRTHVRLQRRMIPGTRSNRVTKRRPVSGKSPTRRRRVKSQPNPGMPGLLDTLPPTNLEQE